MFSMLNPLLLIKKYKKAKTKADSCLCRIAHIHINLHTLII